MSKLISKDGTPSDIEQLMKYCSQLGDIFGYPYYFNWSTSTNHRDYSPVGEVADIGYATAAELQSGLKEYFVLFNDGRPHQSLGYSIVDPDF